MKNKTQIFLVHGGTTFKNRADYVDFLKHRKIRLEDKKRWSDKYIRDELGDEFEIIKPRMPLQDNAKYEDWKIYFERFIPHFKDNVILIGSSLGGIFLAKYLSENKLPKKILSTFLICPPFDNSIPEEDLVGGFELGSDLSMLDSCSENLYLMFSKNDDVVPISHADEYRDKLKNAVIITYESKNGHFNISTFPEIIKIIKSDIS